MATSPLFGWEEPDDTDLVKDGAAAIRTLGNAIDTSLGDLRNGTTGQILAKQSNTQMDFVWADGILNSFINAKGDLITGTANDTPTLLAVGNNGETLVADSSTSTGLRYTAGNPISNPVLNSAMSVWQRGTSFTVPSSTLIYTSDRWQGYRGATGLTITRQTTNDSTNLPFIQYCSRIARDSGNTSTTTSYLVQSFESVNSIPFAGKTVTFSFYARAGANYSPTSSILSAAVQTGTGTDQNWLSYTGTQYPISTNATLTTTWQRFTASATLASTATEIAILFSNQPTGTAGANDYFEITGVQIDIGSVALPFRTYSGTIQGELAACQRYYVRNTVTAAGQHFGNGTSQSTTLGVFINEFPTQMRIAPTALEQSGTAGDYSIRYQANSTIASTVPAFESASTRRGIFTLTVSAVLTAGNGAFARPVNANAYLGWSAEL